MKITPVNRLAGWMRRLTKRRDEPRPAGPAPAPYLPRRVRLFIKPYCPWCRQALDWLDEHGVRYEVLDVITDARAYDEMYRLSGQTLAPVIEVDGRVLADFGARELAEFWSRLPAGANSP